MTYLSDKELRDNRIFRSTERRMGQFIAHAKRSAQRMPHKFTSISEQQWRGGKDRHLCAECDLDYDDPIHGKKS